MAMLEWSDGLAINVGEIDGQHRHLVDMVNMLFDNMKAGCANDVLEAVIADMVGYAREHFGTEERFMELYAYPEAPAHIAEHRQFAETFSRMDADRKAGACALSMDILNYLSSWLVTHITDTDKKFGTYLNGKGVS